MYDDLDSMVVDTSMMIVGVPRVVPDEVLRQGWHKVLCVGMRTSCCSSARDYA